MFSSVLRCVAALQVCWTMGIVHASEPQPPVNTQGVPKGVLPVTSSPANYANKWALVIGTNYGDAPLGQFSKLNHAENDAAAFYNLLVNKFGYEKDKVELLTASAATYESITKLMRESMLSSGRVTADDSVLIYFSGHGYRPVESKSSDGKANVYLLPHDARLTPEKLLDTSKAINITEQVEHLQKNCKARHKLVILDCCHAGALFELPGESIPPRSERLGGDDGAFKEQAFEAIVASRASEQASDGRDGHSPFTAALLRAMEALGRDSKSIDGKFRADELYGTLMRYATNGAMRLTQSPLCRRFNGGPGEFHFIVSPNAEFPVDLSDEDLKLLVAMVPSTFGNWWADEIPWFMPSLRKRVLPELVLTRSGGGEINRENLRVAALRALAKAEAEARQRGLGGAAGAKGKGSLDPTQKRLRLMRKLLTAAQGGDQWNEVFVEAVNDLKELTANPADADPTDLHYLAVLYQKQSDVKNARTTYKAADARYAELSATEKDLLPIWALCLLDQGVLEYGAGGVTGYQEAANLFRRARTVFENRTPPKPFEIFALCREADSYRKLGRFGQCDQLFDDALAVTREWDQRGEHLLTAAAHKHRAWSYMETWDVPAAIEDFKESKAILGKGENAKRPEGNIDRFHVEHGLAMAARFQGNPDVALAKYRALTRDIATAIRDLDNGRVDTPNHVELRYLLYDRMVNSLERQADCSLFNHDGDLAEAADDYRRAVRECDNIAPSARNSRRKELLYCQAIALGLPNRRGGNAGAPASVDLGLARHLYQEAEQINIESARDDRTEIARCLAWTLTNQAAPEAGPPAAVSTTQGGTRPPAENSQPCEDLRQLLRRMSERSVRHDLTVLERLMFSYRYLIESTSDSRRNYDMLQCADELLKLCRAACQAAYRPDDPDPNLLTYLRPYFEVAFLAKRSSLPRQACAKELIEIAWEATQGVPYDKAGCAETVLVAFFVAGDCHLILDSPGTPGDCFVIPEWTMAQVLSTKKSVVPLQLPIEVRKALAAVQTKTIRFCWRDPCRQIGCLHGTPNPQALTRTGYVQPATHAGTGTVSSVIQRTEPRRLLLDPGWRLKFVHGLADVTIREFNAVELEELTAPESIELPTANVIWPLIEGGWRRVAERWPMVSQKKLGSDDGQSKPRVDAARSNHGAPPPSRTRNRRP